MELTEVFAQQFFRLGLLPAFHLLKSYAFMFGCKDTKSFMESANIGSFNPAKKECKNICHACATVDYGNDASPLKPSWGTLTEMFFAIAIANFLLD